MSELESWTSEKQSAYLYAIVARSEKDPKKKKLFSELAAAAENQAAMWEKKLKNTEKTPFFYRPDCRTKLVGWLLKYISPERLRFILSALKVRGMSVYSNSLTQQAYYHADTHLEQRHKGLNTAGNIRAAVFGVNDGLVSNVSLLLGVVGGNANHHIIVLSGVAGLLAGACSMAAGEYISMRSQKEFFEYQIALEKEELEFYPGEEAAELAIIYQARGIPKEEAKQLAEVIISNPDRALDTLAREELGLNPNELGSPVGAAVASFFAFAIGALIPLLPFLFGEFKWNLGTSIGLTAISLFSIGAILSLFTNKNALFSGLRMLLIGVLAGSLTYVIGWLIGAGIGI